MIKINSRIAARATCVAIVMISRMLVTVGVKEVIQALSVQLNDISIVKHPRPCSKRWVWVGASYSLDFGFFELESCHAVGSGITRVDLQLKMHISVDIDVKINCLG